MFSRIFCITGTFLLSFLAAGCSSQGISGPLASPTPQPAPGRIEYPASEIRDLSEEFGLAYPDPLSVDSPDAATLPGIAAYRGEQLYYVSTQASGWVGQEPTEQIAPQLRETLCTLNTQTGQKAEIGDAAILAYTAEQALFTQDAWYYAGMGLSEHEGEAGSLLQIQKLSLDSGEDQTVFTVENGMLEVSFGELTDGAVVFMVHRLDESLTESHQEIYKLLPDNSVQKIFSTDESGELYNFTDFTTRENVIYLLNQPEVEGKLHTEAVCMASDGEITRTLALPGLSAYADTFNYADHIYAAGDYVFIKWYRAPDALPYFSAWKICEGGAEALSVPQNAPCRLLSQTPIQNRYLLFSAFPNEMNYSENQYKNHLYLFDMETGEFTGIHLPYESNVSLGAMVCSEQGTLAVHLTETIGENTTEKIAALSFETLLQLRPGAMA